MILESFQFKKSYFVLNFIIAAIYIGFSAILLPVAISSLASFSLQENFILLGVIILCVWIGVCECGYNAMLYLPHGYALNLHQDYIEVCTILGLKKIPRRDVKGCKNPLSRSYGGNNAGKVIISVSDPYKVIGPYGFKVNPHFHGVVVGGENERSIVKKIRAWRKR